MVFTGSILKIGLYLNNLSLRSDISHNGVWCMALAHTV